MNKTYIAPKHSRHLHAFILLFLSQKPSTGAQLLARMQDDMPFCSADSAGLYRALKALEEGGAASFEWDTTQSGAPRKVYTITPKGRLCLADFAQDIKLRLQNLNFFLKHFKEK